MHTIRRLLPCLLVCLVSVLCLPPASATTYVAVDDVHLVEQAEAAIVGRVAAARSAPAEAGAVTDYEIEVERSLRGPVGETRLTVRVPGGPLAGDGRLEVHGAPSFAAGERVILLLARRGDGTWAPLHLALGVFHERRADGTTLAVRDLADLVQLPDAVTGALRAEPVRDFERFADWIGESDGRPAAAPSYLVSTPVAGLRTPAEPFTFLGSKQRWPGGNAAPWRAHVDGQEGLPGGGYSEFQTALGAWTSDPDSTISYTYGGTTTATTGLFSSDGANTILFNDPSDEMPGAFSCSSGGVLGIGGTWISGTDGNALRIVEGDIVINDGAGCFLALAGGANAAEVFAHELGHTLGLGHSTVADALMRASAYGGGRGARLGSDDRAAVRCLYGDGSTCDGGGGDDGGGGGGDDPTAPAAPSSLSAVPLSSSEIRLAWSDNADDEDDVRVEISSGGSFQQIGVLPADTTGATVGGLQQATFYSFRVRACNVAGCSPYSNTAGATTESDVTLTAPGGLTAVAEEPTRVRLAWNDTSAGEDRFEIHGRVVGGFSGFTELARTTAGVESRTLTGLEPATVYDFRVRACVGSDCSSFSSTARVTTPSEDETNPPPPPPPPPPPAPPQAPDGLTAEALSSEAIRLAWRDRSDDETGFVVEGAPDGASFTEVGRVGSNVTGTTVTGLAPDTLFRFRVQAVSDAGASAFSEVAEARTEPEAIVCSPNPQALCLLGGRFAVEVDWRNQHAGGERGVGRPVPESANSGFFTFFDPRNFELVTKVIDGRTVNGSFWFFYGALSDVEYTIRVTDTETGLVREYHNPPGEICGDADTAGFPATGGVAGEPAGSYLPAGVFSDAVRSARLVAPGGGGLGTVHGEAGLACGDGDAICLLDGRFEVRVDWRNQHAGGTRGAGTGEGRSDQSGTFTFFDPANIELVAKMIDGRTVNGSFWFFYGALSDVEYTIRVTDSETGAEREYVNPPGEICGRADTRAF